MLEALQDAIRTIDARTADAVVGVAGGRGHGSGFVVADGLVLTNAHNVGGEEAAVTFADGRQGTGRVKALDPDGDLAVLAVDTGGRAGIPWADHAPERGTVVFALANPGGRGVRTTFGVVTATDEAFRGPRGRRITGSLEHTAPLPRGASGGPVVDVEGRLVGINTHRLGDGFYLALPADAALRQRVDALGRGESRTRPILGVALAPPRAARQLRRAVGLPERDGLLVRGVVEGGPADAAGIREGDLLVEAGGRALLSADDLHTALDAEEPGGTLAIRLVRGVDEVTVEVALPGQAQTA